MVTPPASPWGLRPRRSRAEMLERARKRDRSCDGEFIVGVLSTGIFCLPSCPAREPKPENVRFFDAPDGAREAGLRACKRCRPLDFYRGFDPDAERAEALTHEVLRDPAGFRDARDLAKVAGVGVTKLNQLFRDHFHTTPAHFLTRARVEAARERLGAQGAERVLEVGLAVGFESNSSFHDNFRRLSGVPPGDYRKLLGADEYRLELPSDFPTTHHLGYLGRDPESTCERRHANGVSKALELGGRALTLTLDPRGTRVHVKLEARGKITPQLRREAHATVVRLLSLEQDPAAFERRLARLKGQSRLVRGRRGWRIPQAANAYEGLVWAILGQQINLPFAYALRRRLVGLCGKRSAGGLTAHPRADRVAQLEPAELLPLQISGRKAEYLIDLSRAIATGELELESLGRGSAEKARRVLLARRGLGPWSVHYLQMRAFGLADCVPLGDTGLTSGLQRHFELDERPDADRTTELMAPFAPFRSFATFHLWNLDEPR